MENTVFRNNTIDKVIWCRSSKADISNCHITANTGIPVHVCACPNTPQLTGININNMLIDNNLVPGTCINIESQPTELNHITIVNNRYSVAGSATNSAIKVGFILSKMRSVILKNSILWNPLSTKEINFSNPASATVLNNCIRNGVNSDGTINTAVITIGSSVPTIISNLSASDPLFINETRSNYRLSDNSPLIGSSIPSALQCDIDNNPRPSKPGKLPDIGCYEQTFAPAGEDLIPVMTSSTSPWGIVTRNSVYLNISNEGWKAFDGNDESGSGSQWICTNLPAYLGFEFPHPTPVVRYFILPYYESNKERAPKSWELQGWDTITQNWATLDKRSNMIMDQEWSSNGLEFPVTNPGMYKKYRIYITETNGSFISIQQLKMYGPSDICPVMSSNTNTFMNVTASSIINTSYPAWKAFDGNNTSGSSSRWISKSIPAWINSEFVTPKTVRSYYIQAEYGLNDRAPKNWTLEGWNESGSAWVAVDSRSNITKGSWIFYGQYFTVQNPGTYKQYRLKINSVNGSSVVSLLKMSFFE
jgi:hypothetical protein